MFVNPSICVIGVAGRRNKIYSLAEGVAIPSWAMNEWTNEWKVETTMPYFCTYLMYAYVLSLAFTHRVVVRALYEHVSASARWADEDEVNPCRIIMITRRFFIIICFFKISPVFLLCLRFVSRVRYRAHGVQGMGLVNMAG